MKGGPLVWPLFINKYWHWFGVNRKKWRELLRDVGRLTKSLITAKVLWCKLLQISCKILAQFRNQLNKVRGPISRIRV